MFSEVILKLLSLLRFIVYILNSSPMVSTSFIVLYSPSNVGSVYKAAVARLLEHFSNLYKHDAEVFVNNPSLLSVHYMTTFPHSG